MSADKKGIFANAVALSVLIFWVIAFAKDGLTGFYVREPVFIIWFLEMTVFLFSIKVLIDNIYKKTIRS